MIATPRFVLALLAAAALAGCGSSAKSYFYTLDAPPFPAASEAKSQLGVLLGPITLPELVDRPQWVLQTGSNQVEISDAHRWAQSPRAEIARALSANLARDLGTPRVALIGQALGEEADVRIAVDILRFESVPDRQATLEALWSVRRAGDAKAASGRATIQEAVQGKGYEALAAAHSRAIARLSRDIAATVSNR